MKKIFILASLVLLFLSPNSARAQQSSSSVQVAANYSLPHPGLLPDSPFYFLKVTRDKIVAFLISDSYKKAEFNLLQADKRLSAGVYLSSKNKFELAEEVISKSENYLEEAVGEAKNAKGQGKIIGGLLDNIYLSSLKHQEVLDDLISKNNGNLKQDFIKEKERAEKIGKMAKDLKSER